jgi:competence protein ComEC
MVAALIGINNKHYAQKEMVNILDVGQGQCITVMTDEVTAVLDCGNMYSIDNAGTTAAARLYSRGRNQVDFLLLSHLHADHANGAVMLMESIKVHNLVIPDDYDDSDGLFGEILACAERNGTEIIRITEDIRIECGDIEITAYKTGMSQEDNERCLISRLKAENLDMLVLADSSARMQRDLAEEYDLNGINAVVVSHHGSKYSYCEELLEEISGEAAIISVGHNYYGHPSQETLEALERYGYNVYRTDIDETIEIEIGSVNGEEKLKSRRKTELFC